jgi:hypothetical protein
VDKTVKPLTHQRLGEPEAEDFRRPVLAGDGKLRPLSASSSAKVGIIRTISGYSRKR